MMDSTGSIFRSASRFFTGTMLSRITGMFRDISMAVAFGTSPEVAAFLVAFRLSHLLRRLFGEGAMQTALIPHFEELKKENPLRAAQFFADLNLSLIILLSSICIIAMAFIAFVLGFGIFQDALSIGNQEIALYTLIMMPSLIFICLFGINAALLQCEKNYFLPSVSPALFNFVWILGVVISSYFSADSAMCILSVFIIFACMAQWLITLPKVLSYLKTYGLPSLWSTAAHFSKDVLLLASPLSLGLLGVGASQINNALDALFARWAESEGPALLWYAIRIQQLPLALFGIAVAGALLPPLSRAAKACDEEKFRHFLHFAKFSTLSFMIPISFLIFTLGDQCVTLLYGRGQFSDNSVIGTTQALWGYTLGLIPMALTLIVAPGFYAKGNYKTPAMASLKSVILNIVLNTLFVAVFDLKAASVAVATSLSAWFNLYLLDQEQNQQSLLKRHLFNLLIPSVVATVGVILFNHLAFQGFKPFEILAGKLPHFETNFLSEALQLSSSLLLFLALFALFGGYKLFRSIKTFQE